MFFLSDGSGNVKHTKQKSNYSLVQNVAFMMSLAWKQRCSVIWLCLIMVATAILLSLTQLFMVPSILGAVEANVSVLELITIILLFKMPLYNA